MADDAKIDESILSIATANGRQMKVAMLIAKVSAALDGSASNESRLKQIASRIEALVTTGHLEGFGNLKRWRRSEVRAAERES